MIYFQLQSVSVKLNLYKMYNSFEIGCNGGWTAIAKTGADGTEISGSKRDLVDRLVAGDEIRISLNDNKNLTSIQSAFLTENENVCVQAIFKLSRSAVYDNFDSDIHWEFLKVCTTGTVHISKWSVGEHTNKGRETSTSDVVWYVRYVSG